MKGARLPKLRVGIQQVAPASYRLSRGRLALGGRRAGTPILHNSSRNGRPTESAERPGAGKGWRKRSGFLRTLRLVVPPSDLRAAAASNMLGF